MTYAESNLLPDENILIQTYGHWVAFVSPVAAVITMLAVWWILPNLLGADDLPSFLNIPEYERFGLVSFKALGVIAIISILWLAFAWVAYIASEFAITDRRVLVKRGIVLRHTAELFLERVESVHLNQTIAGRLLGYGTVEVVGTGETREVLSQLPGPQRFRYALQEQTASSRRLS